MKIRASRVVAILSLMSAVASTASAAKFAIVLHTAAGWQLQGAEKLAINGKLKIRHAADARPDVSADAYKRLPEEVLGSAPLRLHRGGYLVERTASGWSPVFPDSANFKGSSSAQSLWSSATVVYQVDKASKDQAFRSTDIFAILPGAATPAEAAVAMLADERNFRGLGEATPAEAFDDRMTMLVGIAGIADGPALTSLKNMLATAMNTAIQRSGAGTGRFAELTQGLRFAAVSEKAFPSDPQQTALRTTLRDKKAAIDRRIAIVKAFAAASEWDAAIDKYGDFEEYDDAFEDMRKLHEKSFKASEVFHTTEGKELYEQKQCEPALDQIKLAMKRNPGSRELDALYNGMRLDCATTGAPKTKRKELPRAQVLQILNHVTLAESYMNDGKTEDAEAEIVSAEAVDARDPSIILTRAKLLRARKNYSQAIEMLDTYDRLPALTDKELADGTSFRSRITYEMRSGRDTARTETAKAEAEGDYVAALKRSVDGLQLDPNDPELLYHAGLDSAITRNPKDARQYWQSYLAASQSLSSESKRRSEVLNLMTEISAVPKPPAGSPNWFSNYNVPPGVFYDPVSLAPNAHPSAIRASRKQTSTFEWSNGSLVSVKTVTIQGEGNSTIYFDYYPGGKGVRRVSTEPFDDKGDPGLPKLTPAGAVGPGKGAWVALFTNAAVNPWLVERLTGKRVATIVAGNPWFNPFVWTGVYSFLAEYDAEGHVKSARPLNERGGGKPLDFVWDGNKLLSITERGGDYKREMRYEGDRLLGEIVEYRGKSSKIAYKYNGGRLFEANCDDDLSLDSRSRHVEFGN